MTAINTQRRVQRLQSVMAKTGDDALLAFSPNWRRDHVRFLAGFNMIGNWAFALLLPGGEVAAFAEHPWDRERVTRESWALEVYGGSEVLPALAALLGRARVRTLGVVGLELMEARFVEALMRVPNLKIRAATKAVEGLRRTKEPEEIELMRAAARVADLGFQALIRASRVGMPEYEVAAEVEAAVRAEGAEDNFMLMASGGIEVTAMRAPGTRRLRRSDVVISEVTPQIRGYYAQICRTLIVGEPSPAQEKSFDIFLRAQQAALDVLRPGVTIAEVAQAQNRVFESEGFGEYTTRRYTRVRGHCLGLHFDENPLVLEDDPTVAQAGMTLIAHPNTYLPLAGYMVFGDPLLVTENGCVRLNSTERKLFVAEG
jgi:Xaa-Pro aminopeptidase